MAVAAPDERVAWANRMRLLMSPKGAVNADGSIKQARAAAARVGAAQLTPTTCLQEFFKPKQVVYVAEKKWGDAERDKLYEARRGRANAPRSRQRAAARKPSQARTLLRHARR